MKEIFDRNRDRMTDAEDRRTWGALFDATRKPKPAWKRWWVAAPVLATVTAAVVVVALVQRGPADLARERVMAGRPELAAQAPETDALKDDGRAGDDESAQKLTADPSTFELGGFQELGPLEPSAEPPAEDLAAAGGIDVERALKGKDLSLGETLDTDNGAEEKEKAEPLSNEARVDALAESRKPEPTQAEIVRMETPRESAAPQKSAAAPQESVAPSARQESVAPSAPRESAPVPATKGADRMTPPAPERRAQVEMEAGQGIITGQVTSDTGDTLAFADIVLLDTRLGATTDREGRFTIKYVPPGTYTLKVSYLGYEPVEREIEVIAGKELAMDVAMHETVAATLRAVVVEAQKEMTLRTEGSTAHRVGSEELGALPVDQGSARDANERGRGDREGEVRVQANPLGGLDADLAAKPMSRATLGVDAKRQMPGAPEPGHPQPGEDWGISVGGTDPVNGQAFDAMFFEHYGVNPFVDPQEDRFATFAMDVDNASFAMARSYLTRGELPPKEAIRVEEFINAFDHDYAPPNDLRAERLPRFGESEYGTFAIHLDAAPSPFGDGLVLMRVGLKGREVDSRDRKPAVLTFVIDVSGSMAREDRLELVKRALYLLLDQMNDEDEVGLVVYGSNARTILPHTSLRYRRDIERAIASLRPEGATNAEGGLRQGYALADRGYRQDHINRVILCSDGVANVGRTGADDILAEIKREAGRGIEMTAVGFGMGNYNDVLMEKLADQGDGNYYYVDDIAEARRVFVENLTGTLQTIAKQAKIQVEFDPETVRRYRLIGYENRDVADRDFRNDAVDAGEVGAGHEVTALFEVKLEKDARAKDLATVRIRYEDPETGRVTEEARTMRRSDIARRLDDTDATFRMDAAVAEFAEILRHSYWAKGSDLAEVVGLAKNAARDLGPRQDVDEILGMTETAWKLWPRDQAPDWRDDIRPSWEPDDDYVQPRH